MCCTSMMFKLTFIREVCLNDFCVKSATCAISCLPTFGTTFSTTMADSGLWIHLQVPKAMVKKHMAAKHVQPPGQISQYDPEIIAYNNNRKLPTKIAKLLCHEHDLDPLVINQKRVKLFFCLLFTFN